MCVCVYVCVTPEPSTKRRMLDVPRGAAGALQAIGEALVPQGAAGALKALGEALVAQGAAGALQALGEALVAQGAAGVLQALGAGDGSAGLAGSAVMAIGAKFVAASGDHPYVILAVVGIYITYVLW